MITMRNSLKAPVLGWEGGVPLTFGCFLHTYRFGLFLLPALEEFIQLWATHTVEYLYLFKRLRNRIRNRLNAPCRGGGGLGRRGVPLTFRRTKVQRGSAEWSDAMGGGTRARFRRGGRAGSDFEASGASAALAARTRTLYWRYQGVPT
ncbi:hypothetical protein J6590_050103 [Homalodisca vitripennis]|nr:hypothetical protein J6590_050103 [Homalodisca vitripennis]